MHTASCIQYTYNYHMLLMFNNHSNRENGENVLHVSNPISSPKVVQTDFIIKCIYKRSDIEGSHQKNALPRIQRTS